MSIWKKFLLLVVVDVGGFAFPAVERVDYVTKSNVKEREIHREGTFYDIKDISFAAFGVAPWCSWPNANYEIEGFRFNLFAGEHVDVFGLDFAIFGNVVRREFCGLQIAPLFNLIGESGGALQISCFNKCDGAFYGIQLGGVNMAERGAGVQLGLLNVGNSIVGLQLGLINVISDSNYPIRPLVNFAF